MQVRFFFAIFFLGGTDILGHMEQCTCSHTYKGCFRLNKMFYPVGQIKLAVGGTGGQKTV